MGGHGGRRKGAGKPPTNQTHGKPRALGSLFSFSFHCLSLESLHKFLTTCFGHTNAGPRYSEDLLMVVQHTFNWRASVRNRPGYPKLLHYDGLLVDRVNQLYEELFHEPKYRDWSPFNENIPLESAYGIVPVPAKYVDDLQVTQEDKESLTKIPTLSHLATQQKSPLPFLPIRSKSEKQQIHQMLTIALSRDERIGNNNIFQIIATDWNKTQVSVQHKKFARMPIQIAKYFKRWLKNQDRRDAEITSNARALYTALEHTPDINNMNPQGSTFHAVSLLVPQPPVLDENNSLRNIGSGGGGVDEACNNNDDDGKEMILVDHEDEESSRVVVGGATTAGLHQCIACGRTTTTTITIPSSVAANNKKRRKPRSFRNILQDGTKCPIPSKCPGKSYRKNCILFTGGDEKRKTKRVIAEGGQHKCSICRRLDCPGLYKRSKCTF